MTARDRDALLHSARQFVWMPNLETRQAHQIEKAPRQVAPLFCLEAAELEPKFLLVQFDRLPIGDYELGVIADGYANHCRMAQERVHGLSVSCDKSDGGRLLTGPERLYLPVQPVQIDIELRRDGVVLFAHRLAPVIYTQTDGCMSASIFVRPDVGPDVHAREENQ